MPKKELLRLLKNVLRSFLVERDDPLTALAAFDVS